MMAIALANSHSDAPHFLPEKSRDKGSAIWYNNHKGNGYYTNLYLPAQFGGRAAFVRYMPAFGKGCVFRSA